MEFYCEFEIMLKLSWKIKYMWLYKVIFKVIVMKREYVLINIILKYFKFIRIKIVK